VLRNRLDRDRDRDDKRQWVQDRRARTRHLIELGGLVQKAGLVELVDDDRATLLGALLAIADQLQDQEVERQGKTTANLSARWRRRGLRAFDADKQAAVAMGGGCQDSVGAADAKAAGGRTEEDGQPGTEQS